MVERKMASTAAAVLMATSWTIAPAAFAQTPPAAASADAADLDEVIVTAQKRAESVLDVPISMSVVQGEKLAALGITDFNDMQTLVPNFTITPTPANSYVFVRGIGTQGNVLSFESSVALFVDGVYGGRNRQFQDIFLDVARVEVLRGPQGALFGRNTSAGAVSVTSARPTREFEAWTQGDYEAEFGTWSATGAISGPVSDRLQLRFAAKYLDDPGYIRNTQLGRDEPQRRAATGRLSATWQPTDWINTFARLEYGDAKSVGMPFEFVPNRGDPVYVRRTDDGFAPERDDSDAMNALLQSDFTLGEHTLTAIAGYSEFSYSNAINIQGKAPALLVVQNAEQFDQTSLELRLLSPAGRTVEYIVGAYADSATSVIPSTSTTDLPFTPVRPDGVTIRRYVEDSKSLAVFAQATWNVSPTFRLTAGLRHTGVDKAGDLTRRFTGNAPGARNTPLSLKRNESFLDPSFNVQWNFSDRWLAFATYAQGSKSGGFNGPTSTDTGATWMFGDEGSETVELGVKGGSGSRNLSVVVFDTRYTNLQKSVLNILTSSFTTGNAAKAKSRGVEIEGAWRVNESLRFDASAAYLDATFVDYPGSPCPFGVVGTSCNLRGYRLTSAPKWTATASGNWEQPLSGSIKLLAGLTASFRDDIIYQPSYNPLEVQGAFWKLDARLGIAAADDRWSATVLVRNATDQNTSSLIFETFPFGINTVNDRVHVPDRPRTYTLQLRYRFN